MSYDPFTYHKAGDFVAWKESRCVVRAVLPFGMIKLDMLEIENDRTVPAWQVKPQTEWNGSSWQIPNR